MSYLRVWTDASTYMDYPTIWDVSIDPEAISGATYFEQESRSATLTMDSQGFLVALLADADRPAVLPLVLEIWENFTYADSQNEMQPHTRLLFRGYLFRNDYVKNLVCVHKTDNGYVTKDQTITLTIRDWMAVLRHYVGTPKSWSVYVDDSKTTLTAGTTYNVASEINRIWGLAGAAATHIGMWNIPSLVNALQFIPNYGFEYENVEIVRQQELSEGYTNYESAIHWDETEGCVIYEDIRWRYGELFAYNWRTEWRRWKIYQGSAELISTTTHTNWTPAPWDAGSEYGAVDYATDGYYSSVFYEWQTWTSYTAGEGISSIVYRLEALADSNDEYFSRVLMDGRVNMIEITVGAENVEVDTLEWLRYLLDINFSYIRYGETENIYFVYNKTIVNSTPNNFDEPPKITEFSVDIDSRVEDAGSGISGIVNNEIYVAKMNEYAQSVFMEFEKVVAFTASQEKQLGAYVNLPEYHNQPIHITERAYDMKQPFLWHYKGRAK